MFQINAFWKFDRPWPSWMTGRFEVKYSFSEGSSEERADEQPWQVGPHSLLEARPETLLIERPDQRSVVVLSDGIRSLGEAWLRFAIFPRSEKTRLCSICETYKYRRGFRDRLLAEMDEQPEGDFMLPTREDDLFCQISSRERRVIFQRQGFLAMLSQAAT